jgi:hypothetical protein
MHALGNLNSVRLTYPIQKQLSTHFIFVVKSWRLSDGQVDCIIDSIHGLQARILNKGTITEVSKHWITGIPTQIQNNKAKLSLFLQDTYITISLLKNNRSIEDPEFKVTIKHRGRGGMLDGTFNVDTASFSVLAESLKDEIKIHIVSFINVKLSQQESLTLSDGDREMIIADIEIFFPENIQVLEEAKTQHLDVLKTYISYAWQQEVEKQTSHTEPSVANLPAQNIPPIIEPASAVNPQPNTLQSNPQEHLVEASLTLKTQQTLVDPKEFAQGSHNQGEGQISKQNSVIVKDASLVSDTREGSSYESVHWSSEAENAVVSYVDIAYQILKEFDFKKYLDRADSLQVLDKLQRILEIPLLLKEEESFINSCLKQGNTTLMDLLKQQADKMYELSMMDTKEIGALHILLAKGVEVPLKIARDTLENQFVEINTEPKSKSLDNDEVFLQYCQKFIPMLIDQTKHISSDMIDKGQINYADLVVLENAIRDPIKLKNNTTVKETFSKIGLNHSDFFNLSFDLTGSTSAVSIVDHHEAIIPLERVWEALEVIHQLKQYSLDRSYQEHFQKEEQMKELSVAKSVVITEIASTQNGITDLKNQIEQVANESLEVQLEIDQHVQKLIEDEIEVALETKANINFAINENKEKIKELERDLDQLNNLAYQQQIVLSMYE